MLLYSNPGSSGAAAGTKFEVQGLGYPMFTFCPAKAAEENLM